MSWEDDVREFLERPVPGRETPAPFETTVQEVIDRIMEDVRRSVESMGRRSPGDMLADVARSVERYSGGRVTNVYFGEDGKTIEMDVEL